MDTVNSVSEVMGSFEQTVSPTPLLQVIRENFMFYTPAIIVLVAILTTFS